MDRRVLLAGLLTAPLFCQSENNVVPNAGRFVDRAVQGIEQKTLMGTRVAMPFGQSRPFMTAPGTSECAVPLIEAPIPQGKSFAIRKSTPLEDFTDRMPLVEGLPACPSRTK